MDPDTQNALLIGLAVLCLICCIISSIIGGIYGYRASQSTEPTATAPTGTAPTGTVPTGTVPTGTVPTDNTYMTRDNGKVICPIGYNTAYKHEVNVAAGCSSDRSQPCNMCIGSAYPTNYIRNNITTKWPDRTWKIPTLPTDATPSCTGGSTMAFGSTYITTPVPATGC